MVCNDVIPLLEITQQYTCKFDVGFTSFYQVSSKKAETMYQQPHPCFEVSRVLYASDNVMLLPGWASFKVVVVFWKSRCEDNGYSYDDHHWNRNAILTEFSSMAALETVNFITFGATSEKDFIKMTLPFQWFWWRWRWWYWYVASWYDKIYIGSNAAHQA